MVKTITMKNFGRWGRAGNQFFQYAFLKTYAERYEAELQLPKWVGSSLFGTNEKAISQTLPSWVESESGLNHPNPPVGASLVGCDFRGYAQYHTSLFAEDSERIRELFQPVRDVAARLDQAKQTLLQGGLTRIGIHLRRGDYGRRIFPLIPISWYKQWLKEHWSRFTNPVLYIATEEPSLYADFVEYNPQIPETLGISLRNVPMKDCTYLDQDIRTCDRRAMDWYPDFYLLSQCDVILGPSSTFSFFAAMLNTNLREYHRASLATEGFVRTNPWCDYPLLREHVKDYPHLDGITSPGTNPYW